jgi:LL-diaminopimelate aminotransferase
VVVFNSLSKRSAMTCWRVGWICGDRRIVEVFRKMKTNIDSGTPTFIQDAAVAALADEAHVVEMRAEYREKRDLLVEALAAAGLPRCVPEGALYVWQRVPAGMTSLEFAELLMRPETAIVCIPGSLIAEEVAGGLNPGEGYVRLSLTPSLKDVRTAAERIARLAL